jgi:VWFA-related protein
MTRRGVSIQCLAALAATGAATALVLAQTPTAVPASASAQQRAVFRSGVDHVSVDVVVTDDHDQPIADLTKDDFEIVEQGKVQTISDFNGVFIPPANRSIEATASAPESDVVTNVATSSDSRALVMVIDDLHVIETDLTFVKEILTSFVKSLSPDDQAAVVFVGRSDLSVDLTNDPVKLMKPADHLREAFGFGEDAVGSTSPGGNVVPNLVSSNAQRSDFVLKNVAQTLAGSEFSRRVIYFVSGGSIAPTMPGEVPPPPQVPIPDDHLQLMDAFDAARRADVPIYTIDARGLAQPETAVRGGIGSIGGIGKADASQQRAMIADNIRKMQRRLREHSGNTGGRSIENRNDYAAVVDDLMTENGTFYILGYSPDPFVADGQFHSFKVNVKRPNVRVRARQGYVASSATDASADGMDPVGVVIGSGVSVGGVALHATAIPAGPGTAPGTVATAVTIEMSYPPITNDVRSVDDDVQILVAGLTPDGKAIASSQHAIHFTGTAAPGHPVTFFVNDLVDLPSQHVALRIGVASRALGKSGSVQIPLDVPNLTTDALQFGGVLITPVPATGEQALRFDVIKTVVPFQPTTSRAFADTDTIRVVVPVFWGGKDGTAQAQVSITDATEPAPQSVSLTGTPMANGHWRALVETTLPLKDVSAGQHGLRIEVTANGQTAKKLVALEVH